MEQELEHVPNQVGYAVLDMASGTIIKRNGVFLKDKGAEAQLSILHRMFLESAKCSGEKRVRRVSVSCSNQHNYVLAASNQQLCIVKVNTADKSG